jgi:hypothetical protein
MSLQASQVVVSRQATLTRSSLRLWASFVTCGGNVAGCSNADVWRTAARQDARRSPETPEVMRPADAP